MKIILSLIFLSTVLNFSSPLLGKCMSFSNSKNLSVDTVISITDQPDGNYESALATNKKLIETQNRLIQVFYLILTALAVSLFILYNNYKKKVRLALELKTKNEEIESMNEEIQSFNEELSSANEELASQKSTLESTVTELQETQRQLVHAEKMSVLGTLVAGVAHEINNPLNFIQSGANGLKNSLMPILVKLKTDDPSNLSEKDELTIQQFYDCVDMGVNRINGIVKSLGNFSRNTNNFQEECDLVKITEDTLTILSNEYTHRIDIKKDYPEEPAIIIANQSRIYQIISNLLSNSIQAIHNEGEIEISIKSVNEIYSITVRDNGEGMSPNLQKKIFEPFFTTKPSSKGIGLGLALTLNIIEELNGTIHVESEIGEGTEVIVALPKSHVTKE
ncbi:ATP-binding protein [Reichenbachiella ulvae]|uniref:histidine kinase n=1 Tax=Reichenbachiella ulvae TaxID=2980104 RepID=A0ABT3CWK3_9BACT|nr:ATP-binding protein [Reichenbachiella ulvae]MCV9387855.1 ATP-binding protein [Reichenbachiella ulvae]